MIDGSIGKDGGGDEYRWIHTFKGGFCEFKATETLQCIRVVFIHYSSFQEIFLGSKCFVWNLLRNLDFWGSGVAIVMYAGWVCSRFGMFVRWGVRRAHRRGWGLIMVQVLLSCKFGVNYRCFWSIFLFSVALVREVGDRNNIIGWFSVRCVSFCLVFGGVRWHMGRGEKVHIVSGVHVSMC